MRLMAVVPVRNEEHRYLQACLTHLYTNVGATHILVVDDGSTDNTFDVAHRTLQSMWSWDDEPMFWRVRARPEEVASFMHCESDFRSWILQELVRTFNPLHMTDWILVNDADEFLHTPLRTELSVTLRQLAEESHADCLMFGLDELWNLDPPQRRIDKAWATQRQTRMFRYRKDRAMLIPPKAMASGSVPTYAREATLDVHNAVRIVHAGYAHADDRRPKYDRYTVAVGHSAAHVESILDDDVQLVPMATPSIWRGMK